jgi:hypothetical protein
VKLVSQSSSSAILLTRQNETLKEVPESFGQHIIEHRGVEMTRRKLEKTFGLVHYCIVEGTIVILAIIGAWKLIFRG